MYILLLTITGVLLYLYLKERERTTELHKSEARYRSLIENINEVYFITDVHGKTVYVSPNVTAFSGYPPEYYIGKWSHINIYRDDFRRVFLYLKNMVDNGINDGCLEFRAVKKDGTIYWIEQITRILRKDGMVLEIASIVRNISERKSAEEKLSDYRDHLERLVSWRTASLDQLNELLTAENAKLKTAEENIREQLHFLQSLIDTIPNPLFFLDTNKNFKRVNKAFEKFYKVTKDEILGKNFHYLLPEHVARSIDAENDDLLNNPRDVSYESTDKNEDGTESYYMINKATYSDVNGVTNGIAGVIIDITELKNLEKEIIVTLNKEKEWSDLKSKFISYASHEFRTPLTSILSSADLLEMYGTGLPPEKFKKYVGIIQSSVEYMTDLTNDVLTISRSEANNVKFYPEISDLKSLLGNVVEEVKFSCPTNLNLFIDFKPTKMLFNIDSKLLKQVITNLVSNAVKYSPGGGNIKLTVDNNDNLLTIEVSDEGIGIPEENIHNLCEPFYRAANVANIPGTGLGLTIVKKTIEIHNGVLKIKSKLNEGTSMYVIINLDYTSKN